jgi:hypothetical protein
MVDLKNPATIMKIFFTVGILGLFGGRLETVQPQLRIPMTREYSDDVTLGYDVVVKPGSGLGVSLTGQPRVTVKGYEIRGNLESIDVPKVHRIFLPKK